MAIRLVVFDMAGTTVEDNDNVAETLQGALLNFGCPVSIEDINMVMGYPKPVAIRILLQKFSGNFPDEVLVNEVYTFFEKKMISYYRESAEVSEKEGTSEVFSRLKEKGIKVCIDTGFSRNVANTIIDRLGWNERNLIDISITSDEVEKGRPHPDMIFKAMSLMNIPDAAEVAKVGDTISDMREGAAAGCRYIIGIKGLANTVEELSNEPHSHIIGSIGEVTDIILQ